jgi:CheY-like chemotaxis protein
MVVDDEPGLAELMASVLRHEGWEVRTAGDGLSAVHTGREFRPDAVVLDVMLPDLGGLETLRRLRTELPRVCVLFLTARDSVEDESPASRPAVTTTSPSPSASRRRSPGCAACSAAPGSPARTATLS